MSKAKLNILKRMIGKKIVFIEDYAKHEYVYGRVLDVLDDNHLKIETTDNRTLKANIFEIRSPSQDYP